MFFRIRTFGGVVDRSPVLKVLGSEKSSHFAKGHGGEFFENIGGDGEDLFVWVDVGDLFKFHIFLKFSGGWGCFLDMFYDVVSKASQKVKYFIEEKMNLNLK